MCCSIVIVSCTKPDTSFDQKKNNNIKILEDSSTLDFKEDDRDHSEDLKDKPSITIKNYAYQFLPMKNKNKIDKYLNLSTSEFFYLTVTPALLGAEKQSNLKSTFIPKAAYLTTGNKFKVRIILASGYSKKKTMTQEEEIASYRYISGIDTKVSVDEFGQLQIPVELNYDFSDKLLLSAHNKIFLELTPMFKHKGQELNTIRSMMSINYMQEKGYYSRPAIQKIKDFNAIEKALVPHPYIIQKVNISDVFKSHLKNQQFSEEITLNKPVLNYKDPSPYSIFLNKIKNETEIKIINLDTDNLEKKLKHTYITKKKVQNTLKSLLKNKKISSLKKISFCNLFKWQEEKSSFIDQLLGHQKDSCFNSIDDYIELNSLFIVDKITSEVELESYETSSLSVSAGISFSDSESDSYTESKSKSVDYSTGGSVSFGADLFGTGASWNAGVSYRQGTSYRTSHTTSQSTNNSLFVRSNKSYTVSEETYSFGAKGKECLLVEPKKQMKNCEQSSCSKQGALFCQTVSKQQKESWYTISNSAKSRMISGRQHRLLNNSSWVKMLRGRKLFTKIQSDLQNEASQYSLTKDESILNSSLNLLNKFYSRRSNNQGIASDDGMGLFPGMIQ